MAEQDIDALLARMPKIATAVNAFKSESVQQAAFDALVLAFGITGDNLKNAEESPIRQAKTPKQTQTTRQAADSENSGRQKRKSRATAGNAGATIAPVKDLNLRPKGVESFDDFVAKKLPRDNQEKFTVAVYWLEEVAKISPVTLAHLAAVFKQTSGWREPRNLKAGVQMTGFRKNTIDTSDMNNLRTTPHGRNFVEHDLPSKPAKNK
ncbi:hypothetical protein [Sphingopyxis sp. LC363]|uniref:hypothetical protein n=1 Tax=Sphingopyxis sp. LC363 TaxID=1120705 RepID=UPI00050E9DA4|nr:hypothetical protein [Sphingopyxis sp. LC363]KGB58269.1 hypothetical protein FG95_01304 [Sphingopyxis sp. LC363]